ncbi:MAG: bacteriocin [Lachnospiraceae bacterium]|nr:bacteriocin [Lachnospiraceae bacterium]
MLNDMKALNELTEEQLQQISGGYVVADEVNKKYYIVRQDGSVIAPAPSAEKAAEFAKAYNVSKTVMTTEEYKKHFGREFEW